MLQTHTGLDGVPSNRDVQWSLSPNKITAGLAVPKDAGSQPFPIPRLFSTERPASKGGLSTKSTMMWCHLPPPHLAQVPTSPSGPRLLQDPASL